MNPKHFSGNVWKILAQNFCHINKNIREFSIRHNFTIYYYLHKYFTRDQ